MDENEKVEEVTGGTCACGSDKKTEDCCGKEEKEEGKCEDGKCDTGCCGTE